MKRSVVLLVSALGLAASAHAVTLQSVIDGTAANSISLNGSTTYTGGSTITRNLTINGNGALLTMDKTAFERINVQNGATVTINNLRVVGGFSVVKFVSGTSGTLNQVIASAQEITIEHEGTGNITARNCQFSNMVSRAILVFGPRNSTATSVTMDNVYIKNTQYGVQFEGGGKLSARNCTFEGVGQGILTTGAPLNSSNDRAKILGCTFLNGEFGIVLQQNTHADIIGTQLFRYRYPFQVRYGADAFLDEVLIDQSGLSNPSVAVSITDGSTLRAEDSEIYGYMNSFDANTNSLMEVDRCTFVHPQFSGIICISGSEANIRDSYFLDNGQDSIFYGKVIPDAAKGSVENCVSVNAGADNEFGTGIALLGNGPYIIRNNTIMGSLDVGIALQNNAAATIERNYIANNKKAGVYLSSAGAVTLTDNTISGHTASGQAGLTVTGSNGALTVRRNLFAGNRYGIQYRGSTSSNNFGYNFVTKSIQQGASVTQGSVNSQRAVFLDNADWQVLVSSSAQSTFADSVFVANATRRGVYTERGSCSGSVSNRTVSTSSWWNSSSGPQNKCSGSSPDSRMEYQHTDAGSYRSAPQLEALVVGNVNSAGVNLRTPSGGGALPTVTMPGGLTGHSFLGVLRPTSGFTETAPAGTNGQLPICLWVSPDLRGNNGNVTLQIPNGSAYLAHYDAGADTFDDLVVASVSGGTATVTMAASRLQNGLWYFLSPTYSQDVLDVLLEKRAPASGDDANSDNRVDAADIH